jgi:hypothetical protein
MEQFELLRRRFFIPKAERLDATQLELEFEKTQQKLDALAKELDGNAATGSTGDAENAPADHDEVGSRPSGKAPARRIPRPKAAETWLRQTTCRSAASNFVTPSWRRAAPRLSTGSSATS